MNGPDRRDDGPSRSPADERPVFDDAGLAGVLAATRDGLEPKHERRWSRAWSILAIAVAAVVVLSIVTLGALHAFGPAAGSSGPGPNAPTSFYATLGSALGTARASYWSWPVNGQPGLVFAEGLAAPGSLGAAVNVSHLGTVSCAPTLISTSVGSVPAYGGSPNTGLAPEWLYAFQATGNALVVVAVVNGTSAVVATTPMNDGCYNGPGSFNIVPVDSSVAAKAAGATNASDGFFDAATANATPVSAEFFLAPPGYVSPGPTGEPVWIVTDTTCALYGGPASSGTALTSVVNAGTGALYSQRAAAVTC